MFVQLIIGDIYILELLASFVDFIHRLIQKLSYFVAGLPLHENQHDIRLISRPIHAPNHELEDTDTDTPPTKVTSKRTFVELLGTREESVILYLWGMNPLA